MVLGTVFEWPLCCASPMFDFGTWQQVGCVAFDKKLLVVFWSWVQWLLDVGCLDVGCCLCMQLILVCSLVVVCRSSQLDFATGILMGQGMFFLLSARKKPFRS